ncbi:protein-disulfide reductase DsbD [Halomonas piscis]|uniref:Thiol:disulfide interchange protein DsbD n=1 Tax=Halomonas piscis TaxID=3031727 RepID=A0ABY9YY90_9GAMM|nr:protein-disulfide reductase DsbD [Halomonas piscis]WNK19018.1 protein-disulfide reductase DsbD [Halomonas piscis]
MLFHFRLPAALRYRQALWLVAALLVLLPPGLAQAQWFSGDDQGDFLPVREAFQPSAWHDGDTLYIGVEAAEDHYLYRHQFAVESQSPDVSLGEPELPPGTFMTDEYLGEVYTFRDTVVFETPLEEAHNGPFDVELTFQGCADAGLCYPPERMSLEAAESGPPAAFADAGEASGQASPIEETSPAGKSSPAASDAASFPSGDAPDNEAPASEAAVGETPASDVAEADSDAADAGFSGPQSEDRRFATLLDDASLPLSLGLFFLAGLGLTFTPCVLPMLPIMSSIIVGQNPTRPRAFVLSASYVLGMALTYALVGVLMGLFGAGLNLQAHLQSAPVLITFAVLFTLFALAMFGAFDLRLSPRLASRIDAWQNRAQQSGPLGIAVAGALSVLVVSPCVTAPLAGAMVFISSTGDGVLGGAVLFALGLGMGVPLLLVGTFGATLLPRSGAWMNGVKIAFGLLLLGVAIWMVERLVAAPVALMLWAALAVGSALALGALQFNQPQGWGRARQALGILLLAWGIALLLGAAQGNSNPLRPLQSTQQMGASGGTPTAAAEPRFTRVDTLAGLNDALDDAAAKGEPAFVDFTAEWCISCKVMEREVYPDPRVASALADYRLIQADVTETDDSTRELLEAFDLFGPPSLLFFADGKEIAQARIQGEVNADQFSAHLEKLGQWLDSRAG